MCLFCSFFFPKIIFDQKSFSDINHFFPKSKIVTCQYFFSGKKVVLSSLNLWDLWNAEDKVAFAPSEFVQYCTKTSSLPQSYLFSKLAHALGFPDCDLNTKYCPQVELIDLLVLVNHVTLDTQY